MRRTLAIGIVVLGLLFVACSEKDSTEPTSSDPMVNIEQALAEIDSGRVQVAIRAITPGRDPVSFEMSGAFAAASGDKTLPIASLQYSDRSGIKPKDSSFISDGERAWVVNDRGTKEVEGEPLASLRGGHDVAGLSAFNPKSWFRGKPTERAGEKIAGEPTTTYSGDVDAVAVIEDVTRVSANLGAFVAEKISDAAREQIRAAAQNATLEVVAGTDDHLLRSVKFAVDITGDLKALGPVLRELAANRIEFDFSMTEINQAVDPPKIPEGAEV